MDSPKGRSLALRPPAESQAAVQGASLPTGSQATPAPAGPDSQFEVTIHQCSTAPGQHCPKLKRHNAPQPGRAPEGWTRGEAGQHPPTWEAPGCSTAAGIPGSTGPSALPSITTLLPGFYFRYLLKPFSVWKQQLSNKTNINQGKQEVYCDTAGQCLEYNHLAKIANRD